MTTAMTRAKVTTAGLALATLLGCSSTTAPVTAYDLFIELQKIHVIGDCEDTPGNPGEFAYSIVLALSPTAYSVHETHNFPDASGALPYSEDDSPIVLAGTDVRLLGIPAEDTDMVALSFWVREHDPGGWDSDMPAEALVVVPFQTVNPPVGFITIGRSSACQLKLEYQAFWTPAA